MKTDYEVLDTTWLSDQATAALDAIEALHTTAIAALHDAATLQPQRADMAQ